MFHSPAPPFADSATFPAAELLRDVLDVSLSGLVLCMPVYDPADEIIDFTFVYLNPAAQRMLRLPADHTGSYLQRFPESPLNDSLTFYRTAFLSDEPDSFETSHQSVNHNKYFRVVARRSGAGLLVSFTHSARALQLAQANTELQAQQLNRLFMEAPAAICIAGGPDLVIEQVNPRFQAMFSGRALLGLPVLTALPEVANHQVHHTIRHVFETGATSEALGILLPIARTTDGVLEDRYFNYTLQARYDEHGQVNGMLVLAFEVTPQVDASLRAEALQADLLACAQRQAEERAVLYQVFAETSAPICIHRGPEHRYEYLNAGYQALFPGRPLLGLPVAVALQDVVRNGTVAMLDEVYQTGVTFFGNEVPLTIAQVGDQPALNRFFTFTCQAYRENGAVVGISAFAYDVTEQVLARQAHEMERQRLLNLFVQAPAGICILSGPELVFEFANPGYNTLMWGRVLVGLPILEALPELAGSPVAALLHGVYESGQSHEEKSLHVALARTTDGVLEDHYFNIAYHARRDEHGQVDGILVFAFEVTEQTQARQAMEASAQQAQALAEELREANEQLTRTNVDLDTFIYTASHDLKAPISNIEGLLFTLQCELPAQSLTGKVPRILDLMQESVERFKKTIEHLTTVSRLQKEYDQPSIQVALAPVIEDVRLDLVPLLLQTNGHILVDLHQVTTVTFSEKNLRSIVYNLLCNALKYRHPDRAPQVHLRARLEPAYVVIEVQDNGLGLTLTAETQIFAMFQRFHTHVEGSGVGLYMVKRMVENAGGKIEVQSQIDEGSTFTVYLKR